MLFYACPHPPPFPKFAFVLVPQGLVFLVLRSSLVRFVNRVQANDTKFPFYRAACARALLLSSRFSAIIEKFRHVYDVVFIDFPPIDIVTDAIATFESITGYIFVVRANQSDSKNVRATVETMERLGAKILGIVLNDANIKSSKKSYGSKYSSDTQSHIEAKNTNSSKEM